MAALTDLPNELLFEILQYLDSDDINSLYSVPGLNERIRYMFCVVTDVEAPRKFKSISRHIALGDITPLHQEKHRLLRALVEIHDLKHSQRHISTITRLLDTDISVFDEFILNTWDVSENRFLWMSTLGDHTRTVNFENLKKLSLTGILLDPKVLKFPQLTWLKLVSCGIATDREKYKFDLPSLSELAVDTYFESINNSLDYTHTPLKILTLTGVRDMTEWHDIHSSSLQLIYILEGARMTSFQNLTFESLTDFFIRDSDVETFAFMNLPSLQTLHIEQFVNARISMYNVDAPRLTQILMWVNRIKDFYNINIPSIQLASIMLSREPLPTATDNIDLSAFKDLESLKICCAAEITAHTPRLKRLEVRGPLTNELLFNIVLDSLEELCIYFNHGIRESPLMRCRNLRKLSFSRCMSLQDITMIQDWYPKLEQLSIEYCELKDMFGMTLPELKKLTFLSSTSAPFSVFECNFPKLIDFEARNLEIKDWIPSVFQFKAPTLAVLTISNFTVNHLEVTTYPKLIYLTAIGGIRALTLENCDNLIHLNISKNTELTFIEAGTLKNLTSLECHETDYMVNHDLETPLLQKLIYDEMVRYVHTSFKPYEL